MVSPLLKRYLLALDRYKWIGLTSCLGVVGISAIVAMQPPPAPQYRAQGTLVQNAPLVTFSATGSEIQQQGQGIISEDFLLADVLLEKVAQELQNRGIMLDTRDIRDNASVRLDIDSDSEQIQRVRVSFAWPDPEVAETTLSLMFEGMVELSRVTNQARLRAILQALNERLPQAEAELREAQQSLEAYDRLEGPAIQAALDGSLLGAISSSQQQRRQNELILAGLNSQIQSLQQQLGMSPAEAFTSSALSADPIIAQLRAQILETETQLKLLSSDLREAHPTIQELRKNLAAYNTLLSERAAEVIRGGDLADLPTVSQVRQDSALDPARAALADQLVAFNNQREALLQQQQVLAQSEVDLRQQYASLPNKQLERDRLAQQVALKQALYDQIQAKRIDAEAAVAETVSSLTVAEPPVAIREASDALSPAVVMIIGSLLGIVVGGAVVFLLDMLDGTVRTKEDLEGILRDQDVLLLGVIPDIQTQSAQIAPILLQGDSPYNDAYERLRSNLRLAGSQSENGKVPRTILVTSTKDQEGKTITAFNLAIATAHAGRRTLIVETDLRSPSQARLLGVEVPAGALAEPLQYYSGQHSEPIQMAPWIANLYVAPSSGPRSNAAAIIESSEMKQFLKDARARFDMVILDSPPLSRSNDAILLEAETDGLIIVTRPGYTEKAIIEATLEQLLETEDLQVLGAVINGADVPVAAPMPAPEPPILAPTASPITKPQPTPPREWIEF
jgi:capsular exopolysaccharide synthesis family protein